MSDEQTGKWKYVHARRVVLALCAQLGIRPDTVAEVVITLLPNAPVRVAVDVFAAEDAGQAIIDLFSQPEIDVVINREVRE
jgi:hypothetical protein